jgi:hypothetical protein
MRFTISLPIVALTLIFLQAPPIADAAAYTVHPWEFNQRRPVERNTLATDYAELEEFYYQSPQRSITFALHPLNRRRYYNPRPYTFIGERGIYGIPPLDAMYEYDRDGGRWTRIEIGQPAKGVECMNYSFNKPNYRVAPFGYKCQD